MNPAELYVLLASEQLLENVQPGMITSRLAPLKDKIRHLLGESGWRYATQPTHFARFPWTGLPRPGWNIPHRSKEPSKKSTGLPTPASEFSAAAQKAPHTSGSPATRKYNTGGRTSAPQPESGFEN